MQSDVKRLLSHPSSDGGQCAPRKGFSCYFSCYRSLTSTTQLGSGQEAQVDGLLRDQQGSSFSLYGGGVIFWLDLVVLHQLQGDTQTDERRVR